MFPDQIVKCAFLSKGSSSNTLLDLGNSSGYFSSSLIRLTKPMF